MKHILTSLILAFALSACNGEGGERPRTSNSETATTAGGSSGSCTTRAYEEIGGPISLIDQNGERRTQADFQGKHALVFFGFTYCPDVCPLTLVKIKRALDQIDAGKRPVPILISIDPERDTPEALSRYLSLDAYPADTVGLTGSAEEIRAAADAFIADYSRVPLPESAAEYTMDHTSLVYLMDENWKLKTFFNYTSSDVEMAECLDQLL